MPKPIYFKEFKNEKDQFCCKKGPSYIQYYEIECLNIKEEMYISNNYLHREDGPAIIEYYKNGKIKSEFYFLNNNHHRINLPASIHYNQFGKIIYENYYFNDKPLKFIIRKKLKIKRISKKIFDYCKVNMGQFMIFS
jgi:antitoxin component YwqK of YwqJK toxin-antitoxin module